MDELKLNLTTKLMKGIVTKLLTKMIYKKCGCKVDIQLNELQINVVDGKAHLHANVDAEINNDEFMKIVKTIGMD